MVKCHFSLLVWALRSSSVGHGQRGGFQRSHLKLLIITSESLWKTNFKISFYFCPILHSFCYSICVLAFLNSVKARKHNHIFYWFVYSTEKCKQNLILSHTFRIIELVKKYALNSLRLKVLSIQMFHSSVRAKSV